MASAWETIAAVPPKSFAYRLNGFRLEPAPAARSRVDAEVVEAVDA